jgi:quercetin dioxygenase-like cupin family protein
MMQHKYKVGQIVHFSPNMSHAASARGSYEVVRLLPSETLDFQYRVKKSSDGQERVVKESELS